MGGWMEALKNVLRIAYSNKKNILEFRFLFSDLIAILKIYYSIEVI